MTDAACASRSELLAEVVRIFRAEVETLIAEGVACVQLDAPFYCPLLDAGQRDWSRSTGCAAGSTTRRVTCPWRGSR